MNDAQAVVCVTIALQMQEGAIPELAAHFIFGTFVNSGDVRVWKKERM